jgi:hypothetical protein
MLEETEILLDRWQESAFLDVHIFEWSLCASEMLLTPQSLRRATIKLVVSFDSNNKLGNARSVTICCTRAQFPSIISKTARPAE